MMTRKIRIKDIAKLAGVSEGTVDRVIHRRGNVSESKLEAVQEALSQVNYQPNLLISAISMKKKFQLIITIPKFSEGEYWDYVQQGILRALDQFHGIDISYKLFLYDQFDLFSCRGVFAEIIKEEPDAVVIGPTFRDETVYFTNKLSDLNIPYVYVDSMVSDTYPIAHFSSNQQMCGYLIGKLIRSITPQDSGYAICQALRVGDESANNTILRKTGFMDYFKSNNISNNIHRISFSVINPEENETIIGDFFQEHPNVKGVVVLSSRGNIVADYLKQRKIDNIKIICLDLTSKNIEALKGNDLSFLLCQRPIHQGYLAIKALMQHLIYGTQVKMDNYMPLDILTKENIDYYSEFIDLVEIK